MKASQKKALPLKMASIAMKILLLSAFPMIFAACSNKVAPSSCQLPGPLLADIILPDRATLNTVGDMARIILEDEKVIRMKNSDLAAVRQILKQREATHASQ